MECPKCHFTHPGQINECMRCGVVFDKYSPTFEEIKAAKAPRPERPLDRDDVLGMREEASDEVKIRLYAPPAALFLGFLIARFWGEAGYWAALFTHESGHAVFAWFTGGAAVPLFLWGYTATFPRLFLWPCMVAAGLSYGAFMAYREKRWFWMATIAILLVILFVGSTRSTDQALCWVTFGGDAGSFIVSTLMIATFYSRPNAFVARTMARWPLLVFGSIAFMSTYSTWSPLLQSHAFTSISSWLQENTGGMGMGDLETLQQYWTIPAIKSHFLAVGNACLLAMAVIYGLGIVQARRQLNQLPSDEDLEVVAANSAAAKL